MRHLWVVEEAKYTGTKGWWIGAIFRLKWQAKRDLKECLAEMGSQYQYRIVKYTPEEKK